MVTTSAYKLPSCNRPAPKSLSMYVFPQALASQPRFVKHPLGPVVASHQAPSIFQQSHLNTMVGIC